jgi:hypothetical protein
LSQTFANAGSEVTGHGLCEPAVVLTLAQEVQFLGLDEPNPPAACESCRSVPAGGAFRRAWSAHPKSC